MAKIVPAHRTLVYSIDADGNHDIDIAKDLSAMNRRLYRQGMSYVITSIKVGFIPTAAASYIHLAASAAPDTWMTHNAWKKGFNLWRSQLNEVEDVMPGLQGKWSDFKIELDDNSGTALTLVDSGGSGGSVTPDEWNLSNYVWDDDGNEVSPTFCLLGATAAATKIGLVQEYHISRAQVQADTPALVAEASDSIYAKSLGTDEMSDTLIDLVETESDNAPYDMNEMVGGDTVQDGPVLQDFAVITPASNPAVKPFVAPCGLVRLNIQTYAGDGSAADLPDSSIILVEVAPGPYKGVMAEPMGQ